MAGKARICESVLQMHPVLIVTLALVVPSIIVGALIAVSAIRDARDGYEDEHGFWFGPSAQPRLARVRVRRDDE